MPAVVTSWDAPLTPAPAATGFDKDFNTTLTPKDELVFKGWKAKFAPQDSGADYDLRGAFKAGLTPDPQSGHWPDTFKKPNHPTFSDQSQYAKFGKPGSWRGEEYIPPKKDGAAPPVVSSWDEPTKPEPAKPAEKKADLPGASMFRAGPDPAAWLHGIAESAGTLATGSVSMPLAGLVAIPAAIEKAGVDRLPGTKLPVDRNMEPGTIVTDFAGATTYAPKTVEGQKAATVATYPFAKIGEGADWLGEHAAEATGSPAVGAVVNATAQAVGVPAAFKAAAGAAAITGSSLAALVARAERAAATAKVNAAGAPADSVAAQLKAVRPDAPAAAPEAPAAPAAAPPEVPKPPPEPPPVMSKWEPESAAEQQFKPTADWQAVPKDAVLPPGLDIRMNLETGVNEARAPVAPSAPKPVQAEPPADAPTFQPRPNDEHGTPRHATQGLGIVEAPLATLKLSKDVPQFKGGADENGIVEALGGTFDRVGVAPIQVWQRLNGDLEVISGRHRFDLARRSGEETIPAQVHREADGFDQPKAASLDAILNIRDGQGSIADYANYFKSSEIGETEARDAGLLERHKGKTGWTISRDASPEVFASHSAGLLSDEAAAGIARAAPGNGAVQAVGLKMVNEGKPITLAENTMRAVAMMERDGTAAPEQGDIFGFDDSAIKDAQEMAKRAGRAQGEIREQLAAVSGATRRPEIAKKLGVDVKDPAAVRNKIQELKEEQQRLENWPLYPDLVQRFRGEPAPAAKPAKSEAPPEESKAVAPAASSAVMGKHPNTVIRDVRDRDGNKLGDMFEPYDGTAEGAKAAAAKISERMPDEFPDYGNMASRIGATDENGNPKFAISPNLEHVNPVDSREGRYTWGDMNAAPVPTLADIKSIEDGIARNVKDFNKAQDKRHAGVPIEEHDNRFKTWEDYLGNAQRILEAQGEDLKASRARMLAAPAADLKLTGETEAQIAAREAAARKTAEEKARIENAPPASGFTLTGSARDADVAAAAGQRGMFDEAPAEPMVTVYHGSAADFEKFDSSKIGSGEGAQAYGHGLYFAENPKTAEAYRTVLAGSEREYLIDGKVVDPQSLGHIEAAALRAVAEPNVYGKSAEQWEMQDVPAADVAALRKEIDNLQGRVDYQEKNLGTKYTVGIPKRVIDGMLDWDRPLSEQPAALVAVKSIVGEGGQPEKWTGGEAYRAVADYLGGERIAAPHVDGGYPVKYADDVKASEALKAAGFPGIRYLDEGSRGGIPYKEITAERKAELEKRLLELQKVEIPAAKNAAELKRLHKEHDALSEEHAAGTKQPPTRNFVLFEDEHAKITEKNGSPIQNIINLNIGITPQNMAQSVGAMADLARAALERAKATKLGAAASEWLGAVVQDLQTKVVPMAAGTDAARAIAKDFANADRLSRWQWSRFDEILKKNFTTEQRTKMWDAAEDENLIRTQKLPEGERAGRGLDRLTPEERATMDVLHNYGEALLQRAKDVGLFKGEGVEYWSPRMVAMIGEDGTVSRPTGGGKPDGPPGAPGRSPYTSPIGGNISTSAGSLKARKYQTAAETEAAAATRFGEGAKIVRDIRTMPMAMARIERAIASKELINAIKDFGKTSGQELVSDGAKDGYFTIDHPAFKVYRYRQDIKMTEAWDKGMWDSINAFANDIGIEPQRVASLRGRTWGHANPSGETVTRFGGPETVLTHELGHQLDFKYGLVEKFFGGNVPKSDFILKRMIGKAEREGDFARADAMKKQMTINGEMRDLSDLRFEGLETTDYYKKYVRKGTEKIANMVHAYVHAPEKFKAVAPTAYAEWQRFLNGHPELSRLSKIKPSLTLESGGFSKRPPGEDFDVSPIYVSKEFEGPLKAVMSDVPGKVYSAMMDLKGKSMGLIMYSPLIHNGVEWGRALPLMPGKVITFKVYFDGNIAKNNPEIMSAAIQEGLVPIGHRFFMQDITGIMEDPTLNPGRSWTAKAVGGAVGLVNKGAGEIVKRGIDTAGDFWHNTLLWDRIGDLQMGIYSNVKADLIKKGTEPQTAGRISAHFANRYAGALPNESMSALARKVANFAFFSRTFTFGNLGVMKDMINGLPRDVQAQILRDAGEAAKFEAKGIAQRTAIKAFAMDIALMYGMNSALQSGFDAMKRDKSLDQIQQGYVDRFERMVKHSQENPSDLLKPFAMLESLTPLSENEPGKEYRVLYDYEDSGTGVYVRLPTGKIGEEFLAWGTSPLDILKRKEGTVFRPLIQMMTNDKGFGRRVYNPDLPGFTGAAKAVGNIAWNFMSQQAPGDSLESALELARGKADKTDALKVVGPFFGLTFSKGAPGGPEIGEMFTVERRHRAEVADAMPDVKKLLKHGDTDDALARMYEAHMTPQEIKATLRFAGMPRSRMTPKALLKFYQTAPPEEKDRMNKMRDVEGREDGGPIVAGKPYLVGEAGPETAVVGNEVKTVGAAGPEIIVPPAGGMVLPNTNPLSTLLRKVADFAIPSAAAAEFPSPRRFIAGQEQSAADAAATWGEQKLKSVPAQIQSTVPQSMGRDARAQANAMAREKLIKSLIEFRHMTPQQAAAEAARQIP